MYIDQELLAADVQQELSQFTQECLWMGIMHGYCIPTILIMDTYVDAVDCLLYNLSVFVCVCSGSLHCI
jgi:hypothetical protein